MAEFTGERVIPGQVDVDLLNEHMARYTFAARLARGKRVLDAGCGAGYGSAELANAAESVVGIDLAREAIDFARAQYSAHNLTFEQASCEALPYADSTYDLVVGLRSDRTPGTLAGIPCWKRAASSPLTASWWSPRPTSFITPSRAGRRAPTLFTCTNSVLRNSRTELKAVFPHVSLFLENHVEGFTFQPHEAGHTAEVRVDAGEPAPDESHFFVAVCANRTQTGNPTFVYVPRAANVLRERERHIDLLQSEVNEKNQWLADAQQALAEMTLQYGKLEGHLEESNRWAESLNQELDERRARVAALQEELATEQRNAKEMADAYDAKVRDLEEDIRTKIKWAKDVETALTAEVVKQTADLVRAVEALHHTEKELQ